jgi:hypothetical protein
MTAADIIKEAYAIVTDMESDLSDASVLADGVAILAVDSIEDEKLGAVLMRIGRVIANHCKELEERRGELFKLLHPNRAIFEKEGWRGGGRSQERRRAVRQLARLA